MKRKSVQIAQLLSGEINCCVHLNELDILISWVWLFAKNEFLACGCYRAHVFVLAEPLLKPISDDCFLRTWKDLVAFAPQAPTLQLE